MAADGVDFRSARDRLKLLVEDLLVGPLDANEVLPSSPSSTYLTGILWPKGISLDPSEDDATDGEAAGPDSEADTPVPGYRAMRPCSVGITFATKRNCEIRISLGRTSRYELIVQEGLGSEEGGADSSKQDVWLWARRQLDLVHVIKPSAESGTSLRHDFIDANGDRVERSDLGLHIKQRTGEDFTVFTVTLVNLAEEPDQHQRVDESRLFQAELVVEAHDENGLGAIFPRRSSSMEHEDEDRLSNDLIYRRSREFAVGHGVAATWFEAQGNSVTKVATTWMPGSRVKNMSHKGHDLFKKVRDEEGGLLQAAWLGTPQKRAEITKALGAFAGNYREWITDFLVSRIESGEFEGQHLKAAESNLQRCEEAARRMKKGIKILASDDTAWEAFILANQAMERQSNFPSKGDRRGALVWRPFQLAFILIVLPGLANPSDPDRETMDLLWFPTGGGKTEAYLALTAFQIFWRRLTDRKESSGRGVDVLMRYTLRLLTIQQFQRAASMIAACELIRRERTDLGTAPISIGLYVGDEATPNRLKDARDALEKERQGEKPRSTPVQLLSCPVCGGALTNANYRLAMDESDVEIRCSSASCDMYGEPLPITTCDEAIYKKLPSLLIGTVDKFAQLPRRDDIGKLFGSEGTRKPGLIIQDELHLISGPLGSMSGLYEAAIDLLCTEDGTRPKIIGSTATIGRAANQVRALFDRDVLQFPPPGVDADDSYFAVVDNEGADRLYLGICSAGRSPKFALQALIAALLQGGHEIKSSEGMPSKFIDPYWTCVCYFNSLRELGGAYVLVQDDVPRQMEFLRSRLGSTRRPLEHEPMELSGRISSREIPEKIEVLEATLMAIDEDPFEQEPIDIVLASSMISVGVDISRLGLMVVNGQPKSTSEYIQASSRVGRGLDGIVITSYNFGRPRDVSHFEHFCGYHAALYRNVEATSVTPFAPRARDKALHGVFASAVRHLIPNMVTDGDARKFDAGMPGVEELISYFLDRAENASDGFELTGTQEDLEAIVAHWSRRASDARAAGGKLLYWERKAPYGRTSPHLMTSAEDSRQDTLAWRTPNSMREVEPSTAFRLRRGRKGD